MTVQNQIPFLYKVAYRFTTDKKVADDLVQETCYKALKNKNRFKEGTNLRAWLSVILRNIFINDYRKKSRYFNTDNISIYASTKKTYRERNGGESIIAIDYINKAIDKLPVNFKGPFVLYLEGYAYREIADKYSVPLGTIKSRIHLARKYLKNELKELKAA